MGDKDLTVMTLFQPVILPRAKCQRPSERGGIDAHPVTYISYHNNAYIYNIYIILYSKVG
jgi:hypothetical protein